MKAIGGYFGLEAGASGDVFHNKAVALNSGRSGLEYILLANQFGKVYLPYFTCDVLLEPCKRHGIPVEFYPIDDNLDPVLPADQEDAAAILVVNYFGLKSEQVKRISQSERNIIIDNAQAFFDGPASGNTLYSPRKYFGLPDGGYVYSANSIPVAEKGKSIDKISHLLKRIENGPEAGYQDFKLNDARISSEPLARMSDITRTLCSNINYPAAAEQRKLNFDVLQQQLGSNNRLNNLTKAVNGQVPMVYPLLPQENGRLLKEFLVQNKVYCATYWPNVLEWRDSGTWEYYLAENLVNLPVDHRWTQHDMESVVELIAGFRC